MACRPLRLLRSCYAIKSVRIPRRLFIINANDLVEPDFLTRFQAHVFHLFANEQRVNHARFQAELAQVVELLEGHAVAQGGSSFQLVVKVAVDGFIVGTHRRGISKGKDAGRYHTLQPARSKNRFRGRRLLLLSYLRHTTQTIIL